MKNLKLYVVDANRSTTSNGTTIYAVQSDCEQSLELYKNNQPSAYPVSYLDKDPSKPMLFFSTQTYAVAMLEYNEEDKRFYLRHNAETRAMCKIHEQKSARKLKALASAFLNLDDDDDADAKKADAKGADAPKEKPKSSRSRKRELEP
jgi:hypothetical protein